MFVHNFAALEIFVIEVDDGELEFGDIIQKLCFYDLHQ